MQSLKYNTPLWGSQLRLYTTVNSRISWETFKVHPEPSDEEGNLPYRLELGKK